MTQSYYQLLDTLDTNTDNTDISPQKPPFVSIVSSESVEVEKIQHPQKNLMPTRPRQELADCPNCKHLIRSKYNPNGGLTQCAVRTVEMKLPHCKRLCDQYEAEERSIQTYRTRNGYMAVAHSSG